MGNRPSRRNRGAKGRYGHPIGEIYEEGDHIEDIEGTEPDSYNKFLAWMIEMAENDDSDLDSPDFVEHITSVCAKKQRQFSRQFSQSQYQQPSFDCHLEVPTLELPARQHSVESTTSSKYSRSSRSKEDLLDPKTRFRRTKLSRQRTVDFSDDGDITGLSGGSSFERDDYNDQSHCGDTVLLNKYTETSFMRNPKRPPLWKNNSCTTYSNISPSLGDLLNVQSRRKSKSLMTMRKALSETRNDDEITPITEETVVKLLDDNILDGNMADILFSVEALWPKGSKRLT
ncbi:hypothetical protein MAR_001067 [Mya arenaria]|uniref:Uncharacterized protein n=1 Tax=Mya arenaria TaxID=6604 RepID=A0ABY7FCY7_MYAAR|nr:uncharacterized protein LOC128208219 [Mya arenaria]WAR19229.1 hypothetical protein MAR_001067 [Mya arenaria]